MKIGNIIYEKELVNHVKVDFVNYYNEAIEYDKLDKTLPTLCVGWSFMKSCNVDNEIIQNADILKKKIIANELYWECSFEESKSSHIKGVGSFINLIPQLYFPPKYQYINLDPVFFQLKDIEDLMDVIPKHFDVLYRFKDEMIYILFQNKISGINLKTYEFYKFDIENLCNRISERANTIHIDLDGKIHEDYYKILPKFTQLKRYLITLLTK